MRRKVSYRQATRKSASQWTASSAKKERHASCWVVVSLASMVSRRRAGMSLWRKGGWYEDCAVGLAG
jgi:hypothetical protein